MLRKKGQRLCQGARWQQRRPGRGLSCCECKQPLYGEAIEKNECLVGVHWRVVAMVISAYNGAQSHSRSVGRPVGPRFEARGTEEGLAGSGKVGVGQLPDKAG